MTPQYVLAPQAARDLVQIWRYVKQEVSRESADRVESVIRSKFTYLATFLDAGHWRRDLTSAEVRFFSVYSYLIVYRSDTNPLQVVTILHGSRDVANIMTLERVRELRLFLEFTLIDMGQVGMAKTYKPYQPEQDLLLPPSLKDWLREKHLADLVSAGVDELDLSGIEAV